MLEMHPFCNLVLFHTPNKALMKKNIREIENETMVIKHADVVT